ncbi:MAG TPA: aldehyde dehydrogenase family protein [Solirubrobacteraceae bacterium]|nr:aldehyde dehydrogenase family protein [Solirubrobacteraceae bacterium]
MNEAAPLEAGFVNEPLLELRRAAVRARLGDALAELDARGPLRVAVLIGEERGADRGLISCDPGQPDRVVAEAGRSGSAEVDAAVAVAARAAPAWGRRPAAERAQALLRAAAWLRERRLEVAALEVRECAKPWPEADADVCEAIDYLEYYARQSVRLAAGAALAQAPGESNRYSYAARGVAAVIAPWNFPVAIPMGMTAAAVVAGNAAVLKPAEQSPGCGSMVVAALRAGGVPPAVLGLLPGEGDTGAALVRHPDVALIAFTGSVAVGLSIMRAAADVGPGQQHLKHVIAELGGKNCVIVDADADLDQAVPAIVASAFAYAGQKCSAASRVLVCEAVAESLLQRLTGAVARLVVGQASELGTDVPPVIEAGARDRIEGYVERAAADGRILVRPPAVPSEGWFCPPTLAADLDPRSPVLVDEVFGPLLTVEQVPTVDAACEIVDGLPVGLTGGLFSRDPATVDRVIARSPVGNVYVNRAITGAMVGRQPFGGGRLSGTGTKAGGPDYLLSFLEPRVVCENTTRHGLVV